MEKISPSHEIQPSHMRTTQSSKIMTSDAYELAVGGCRSFHVKVLLQRALSEEIITG